MDYTYKPIWIALSLLLLAACAGPGKPTVKLSATPTALEDGQSLTLKADTSGGQGSLKVEFYKGAEKVGEDAAAPYELSLPITVQDDVTLAFSAKVIASDGQSAISEAVSVSVKVDKEAPKVSLASSSPSLNTVGPITLTANATDNKGVVKVEFFKGAIKLGEDTTPADGFSLSLEVNASDNGTQKYTAKAYDKKGNMGISAEVSVSVDIDPTPPSISLSSDKTSLTAAGSATLIAQASDNKGVSKVEFFEGGTKLAEDTEGPYTFALSFTATNNGNHTYSAKAFDSAGNSTNSNTVSIFVNIDATIPVVTLSSDKTKLTQPGSINLSATATDDKGISKVEFYVGDSLLREFSQAPYSHTVGFVEAQNGSYVYTAKAYDESGNIASSEAVTVLVDIDTTPPTFNSFTASPSSLNAPGSITLSADASDKNLAKVEFYKNGNLLGEDTTAPFTFMVDYSSTYSATDHFSAKAFDQAGNSTPSASVDVAIDIDATNPSLSLSADPTTLSEPGNITLSAESSDNKGVTKLEFFKNSTANPAIHTVDDPAENEEHQVALAAEDNGTVKYIAKAYDASGNSTSSEVDVGVAIKPNITLFEAQEIEFPDTGGTTDLNWSGDHVKEYTLEVSPAASIHDLQATNAKVTLPANTTTGPISYILKLKAKAHGNAGIPDAEATLNLTLNQESILPVVWLEPINTNFITSPSSIILSANASDASGIDRVEFYDGATLVVSDNDESDGYGVSISYNASHNGQHNYFARAYDKAGNSQDSDVRDVDVQIAPQITSFTSTSTNLSADGGSITLSWSATHQQNFSLSVDNSDGVSGMPDGITTATSVTLNFSANETESVKPYAFTLTANPYGSLAVDSEILYVTLRKPLSFSRVGAGHFHTCGLAEGKAYCWGDNVFGQLGNGSFSASSVPVAVDTGQASLVQMAGGEYHTCALSWLGDAYCWGRGEAGQLGNGLYSNSPVPVEISGATLSQITAGSLHTCALAADGKAYCWGNNSVGQLGTGSTLGSGIPALVSFPTGVTSFLRISAGSSHTCAIGSDLKAYCWGRGNNGQLGRGIVTDSNVPVAVDTSDVLSGINLNQIAAGASHTCATDGDGKAYCWGNGSNGQLGNGSSSSSHVPVAVNASGVLSGVYLSLISAGGNQTCTLGNDRAYCWGSIASGSNVPVAVITAGVLSGIDLSQISSGFNHTCAVGSNHRAYCWGNNGSGQLGDGSTGGNLPPLRVKNP